MLKKKRTVVVKSFALLNFSSAATRMQVSNAEGTEDCLSQLHQQFLHKRQKPFASFEDRASRSYHMQVMEVKTHSRLIWRRGESWLLLWVFEFSGVLFLFLSGFVSLVLFLSGFVSFIFFLIKSKLLSKL